MNHRDLVLSARRKAKFAFLELPEDLQDEIIDGLDNRVLDLRGAGALIQDRGYSLSFVAVSNYYAAVRNERRLYETTQELTRVVEQFQGESIEQNAGVLANFLIATAVRKLSDGELGIKDVDLGKILQAMTHMRPAATAGKDGKSVQGQEQAMPEESDREPGLSGEMAAWIREQVLGVRKPKAEPKNG